MAIFAAIGAALSAIGGFITAGSLGLSLVSTVAKIAASFLVQKLLNRGQQNRVKQEPFALSGKVQSGEGVPRSIPLGRAMTAGSLVYANTWTDVGAPNEYLVWVIALSDVPVAGLAGFLVNGEYVTPDPAEGLGGSSSAGYTRFLGMANRAPSDTLFGTAIEEYKDDEGADNLWIRFYDGTQTYADGYCVQKWGSASDRRYGSDRIGRGMAYAVVTAKVKRDLFSGFPQFRFILDGAKLYDPSRDSTNGGTGTHRWEDPATWGGDGDQFPVVQAYNLARGFFYEGQWLYGFQGIHTAQLPGADWVAEIEKCRLEIAAEDGPGGGPTEPQYRASGEMQVSAPIGDSFQAILSACAGRIAESGGIFKPAIGAPSAVADMLLEDDDILVTHEESYRPFVGIDEIINAVTVRYPEPDESFNMKAAPAILNAEYETEDGGQRRMEEVSLPNVPYREQAQRLARAALNEARRMRTHVLQLPTRFAILEPNDIVSWASDQWSYASKLFRVDMVTDVADGEVIIQLTETDPSDFDWDRATDYTAPQITPITVTRPATQVVPGFNAEPYVLTDNAGFDRRSAIRLTWTGGDEDVRAIQWQRRILGQTAVVAGSMDLGDDREVIVSDGIIANETYEFRAQFVVDRSVSWTGWVQVTAPDVRILAGDLVDDLQDRIDTAFERHDDAVADATGTVGDLRDLITASFGDLVPIPNPAAIDGAAPLVDVLEIAFGPLDATISINDRLNLEVPNIRSALDETNDLYERMTELIVGQFSTDRRLVDAGIIVDPESGQVKISALDATNNTVSQALLRIDAAESEITQRVTFTEMNQALTNLTLDPTQIPVIDDLEARITNVASELDAQDATLTLLSDTLSVSGGLVTMTSVTSRLDSLEGTIVDKVDSAVFDTEVLRITAAEQTLEALGDTAAIRNSVSATAALTDELNDLQEATIAQIWEAWNAAEGIRAALATAQEDLVAYVDAGVSAEASSRTELQATIESSLAQLEETQTVLTSTSESLGESITTINVSISNLDDTLTAQGSAVDALTVRVATTEDGLVAEGESRRFLGVALGEAEELLNGQAEQSISDIWNLFVREQDIRGQVAVQISDMGVRIEENRLSEATAREVLGAAIDDAQASIRNEAIVRATDDEALAQEASTLAARVAETEGQIQAINTVDLSSTSALVQAHLGLDAAVNDPATGLPATVGRVDTIETLDLTADTAFAQRFREVTASIDGGQVITNGSFATGDLLGWSSVPANFTVVERGSSTATAVVNAPQQWFARVAADAADTSAIGRAQYPCTPGDSFDLSIFAATWLSTTQGAYVAAGWYDADGVFLSQTRLDVSVVDAAWAEYLVGRVVAPANAVTVNFRVGRAGGGSAALYLGRFKVDHLNSNAVDVSGRIADVETLQLDPSSALIQRFQTVEGRVGTTEADITSIENLTLDDSSALVQRFETVEGRVDTAEGAITDIENLSLAPSSALAQAITTLRADVDDPATGLTASSGRINDVLNLNIAPTTALLTRFTDLEATVNDPATGVDVTASGLSGVVTRIDDSQTGLEALAGRSDLLEASFAGDQILPNGDFITGDLSGWTDVPSAFEVIQRGSTTAAAVVAAPRLYILRMSADPTTLAARAVDGHTVVEGEVFELRAQAATWVSTTVQMSCYVRWLDHDGVDVGGHFFAVDVVGSNWQEIVFGEVTAPANVASMRVRFGRVGGGSAYIYASNVSCRRVSRALTNVRARVDTIEAAYVDADGAIAAVETQIEANYGSLSAMASSTAFARAQADGIEAGYLWRLNGSNVMELVSVSDGVTGSQVTARIDADYVQITGLTQIDTAVIEQLATDTAFISELTVTDANIQGALQSDNYAEDGSGDPTAGFRLDRDTGVIKAAGGVITRPLAVTSGIYLLPTVITASSPVNYERIWASPLIPTGIFVDVSQVWMPLDKVYAVQAAFVGGVTADTSFDPNNTHWSVVARLDPAARWNGPQQLRLYFEIWAQDITRMHAAGDSNTPGQINWQIYEVT